jgi:cellulose synthase/poly-beta-1,6-N-acetylglucosamine synthase-like glycosyltransferase
LLESGLLSSSIVIAVCYGFRRGVIEKFPGDVIADDIYLPFQASLNGYRIVYSENALAYELRASQSLGELYKHKMRKSNAFLIEIFRFLGKTLKGRRRWWMIFITRMLQMVVIPLLIPVYFILSLAVGFAGESTLLLASLSLVGVSVFISHMLFQRMRHGVDTMEANIISSAKVFMLMNLIQLVSIIRYPFFRQTSSYEKIR